MDLNSIDNPDNKINKYILEMIKTSFNYFVSRQFMVNIYFFIFYFICEFYIYEIFKKKKLVWNTIAKLF